MAYTFVDHYRPIRAMLRVNALVVGLGLGVLLLIYPANLLTILGIDASAPLLSKLAGSALLGLGIGQLLAAAEADLRAGTLVGAIVSNGLLSASLFVAYARGDLSQLTPWGYLFLFVILVICLFTAVLPIPYLRQGIGM